MCLKIKGCETHESAEEKYLVGFLDAHGSYMQAHGGDAWSTNGKAGVTSLWHKAFYEQQLYYFVPSSGVFIDGLAYAPAIPSTGEPMVELSACCMREFTRLELTVATTDWAKTETVDLVDWLARGKFNIYPYQKRVRETGRPVFLSFKFFRGGYYPNDPYYSHVLSFYIAP